MIDHPPLIALPATLFFQTLKSLNELKRKPLFATHSFGTKSITDKWQGPPSCQSQRRGRFSDAGNLLIRLQEQDYDQTQLS